MDLYKRYIFWCLRVMSHVPGYKRYSRWMIRQHERSFWRGQLIAHAIGITTTVAYFIGLKWLLSRQKPKLVLPCSIPGCWCQDYEETETDMAVVSVAHIIDVAEPYAMVVLMDNGTPYQTAFHWFSDELSFTEDEVIGLTLEECRMLHFNRDVDYLRSS